MIGQVIDATIQVMTIAIFARSILSFFIYDRHNPIMEFLITITEPLLGPIRRFMPRMGMFDMSPLIAILLLQFLIHPLARSLFT